MWDKLLQSMSSPSELLGILGQLLFVMGWGVQWYMQSKLRRNFVPVQFWMLRFAGACLLLGSSIAHDAWAVSFGFIFGLFFYGYNIAIFKKLSGGHATPAAG